MRAIKAAVATDPRRRRRRAPPVPYHGDMDTTAPRRLAAPELAATARRADLSRPCPACAALRSPGWESMPSAFDRRALVQLGTLRDPDVDEPTLQEHHPHGTHAWSAQAPIALAWYPYNRCEVWACRTCRRAYLRYTEYGGYYHDERVREVDPALIDDLGRSEP